MERSSRLYPFASFSPEWVAIEWAARAAVPVRFVDLPSYARPSAQPQAPAAQSTVDPLEELFEFASTESAAGYFDRLAAVGAQLRSDPPDAEMEAAREHFMAAALSRAKGRVVLLCGAAHASAVAALSAQKPKPVRYKKPRSRGIQLCSLSDVSLARSYGVAPAHRRAVMAGSWMDSLLNVAQTVRALDFDVSTADSIFAAELALRLARFRGRPSPARTDLREAAHSSWAKGATGDPAHSDLMRHIDQALCGDRTGEVGALDDSLPKIQRRSSVGARRRSARRPRGLDSG